MRQTCKQLLLHSNEICLLFPAPVLNPSMILPGNHSLLMSSFSLVTSATFRFHQCLLNFPIFFLADMRSAVEGGSICSDNSIKKEDHSSHSSTCVVDTTTKGEDLAGWRGRCKSCESISEGYRSFLCCSSDLILRSNK